MESGNRHKYRQMYLLKHQGVGWLQLETNLSLAVNTYGNTGSWNFKRGYKINIQSTYLEEIHEFWMASCQILGIIVIMWF